MISLLRKMGLPLAVALSVFGCNKPDRDQAQISEGYRAAEAAPAVPLVHKLQTFEFQGNIIELLPPERYVLKEVMSPIGKMFVFSSPNNADGRGSVITITINVLEPDSPPPPTSVVIESMLAPFEKNFANYVRAEKQPLQNSGLTFEGASFSATAVTDIKGTVMVAPKNRVLYIISAICPTDEYVKFEAQLSDMMKSLKVLPGNPS